MRPFTALLLGTCLIVALLSFVVPSYWLTLLIYVGISALVCIGLCVMTGSAGITSFGQAAFVGLGAYTTALLTTGFALSPWLSLPASIAVTVAMAFVIGWITVRLSGHYLVLGTFAWSIGLFYVFANVGVLGGYNGISGLPSLFLGSGDERIAFNILVWAFVAVVLLISANILDSRPGRAIRSAPSPAMAESFGIDTSRYKLIVFVLAAASAGLAGWLQAHFLRFVNPNPYHLNASVEYLFMTIIGGVSSLIGALAGSMIVVVAKSWLQGALPGLIKVSGNYEIVAFGAIVLLLLHFAPRGITAALPRSLRLYAKLAPGSTAASLRSVEKPEPGKEILRIDNASKNFGGLRAVDNVSLNIRAGEIVALVGPNGAGKSTLFDMISGLSPLSSGTIVLLDQPVGGLTARAIAQRGLSRTFQHAHLRADMTVLENVALGGHLRSSNGVLHAALRLDRSEENELLSEAAGHLKRLGLDGLNDEPAGALALGQQRIVEVARALMADPIIVLLDEPGAGLRFQEKQHLASVIRDMQRVGIAVLLVEHDLAFVTQIADRLIVLDFGTKIADGTASEVTRDRRVIEAYLGKRGVAA